MRLILQFAVLALIIGGPVRDVIACQCSGFQPLLVVPVAGMSHPADAGFLVASPLGVTPYLYDDAGALLELKIARRAGGTGGCSRTLEYLLPGEVLTQTRYQLLLTDGLSADVPYSITINNDFYPTQTSVTVSLEASRVQTEPLEFPNGGCNPTLSGAVIVGALQGSVSVSPFVPFIVEVSVEDAVLGPLRDVPTNFDRGGQAEGTQVSFSVPLTENSANCATVNVLDWTLRTIWSTSLCPGVGETLKDHESTWVTSVNIAPAPAPPRTYNAATATSCSVTPQGHASRAWVLSTMFVLLAARVRRRTAGAFCIRDSRL